MSYIPKIIDKNLKNLEIIKVPGTEALFKCESITKTDTSNGIKPIISYVYFPEGSKTFVEWEIEHGAIQWIKPFDPEEDNPGYVKDHFLMKNVVIHWTQLAVEGRGLPDKIYNRDYKGLELSLKDFIE